MTFDEYLWNKYAFMPHSLCSSMHKLEKKTKYLTCIFMKKLNQEFNFSAWLPTYMKMPN